MNAIIDTSVVLRLMFGEVGRLTQLHRFSGLYASELLQVEAMRAIDRQRLLGTFDDNDVVDSAAALRGLMQRVAEVTLTRGVLRRAMAPFPTVVRTLDAIHLATALEMVQDGSPSSWMFLTHDLQQAACARALGFQVQGVPKQT